MGEPWHDCQLTADERQALARLRQGPQSLHELAETLGLTLEQTQGVIHRLNRKVGLVRLFRSNILRYGLAE
jgi:DNA-binding CsgD family transcriptional regulator